MNWSVCGELLEQPPRHPQTVTKSPTAFALLFPWPWHIFVRRQSFFYLLTLFKLKRRICFSLLKLIVAFVYINLFKSYNRVCFSFVKHNYVELFFLSFAKCLLVKVRERTEKALVCYIFFISWVRKILNKFTVYVKISSRKCESQWKWPWVSLKLIWLCQQN